MANRSQAASTTDAALALDPGSWPADWRLDWEVKEEGQGSRVWHRSGLCFFFEFEPVDERGSWAWVVYNDDLSQSRLAEMQAEMGDEAFNACSLLLGRQAKAVWQDLGHSDFRLGRQRL